MLDGRIERKLMLVFFPKQIITQSATIDDVLGLFGDIRFVRLQIKFIPSAAELIRGMILQTDTAELRRTVIGAQPECIHIQLSQLRETVPVRIIRITVPIRLIQSDAIRIIF